ncbi:unnamed protein product [Anisakis simplex]|uniref:Gag-pol polyprotein n=1 Tax=Anisakis simplex TaxID=6269 RepID=A0A0M3IYF1_ANISI|nr:unnamed protein product [Anisakis simplex]
MDVTLKEDEQGTDDHKPSESAESVQYDTVTNPNVANKIQTVADTEPLISVNLPTSNRPNKRKHIKQVAVR